MSHARGPSPRSGATWIRVALLATLALASPASALARPSAPDTLDPEAWIEVEVATVGIDLGSGAPLALLHEGWDEVLPIWIGENEAQAILQVLQGIELPRPMTHDLMASMLRELDAELVEVRIHDLREGAYIGSLHVRRSGEEGLTEIDSRPSDALALALRAGAQVRVARRLLAGVPDVDFVSNARDRPISRLRGVTVALPGPEDRTRFDLPADRDGLAVLHVPSGGTGRQIEVGDLIVEADGRSVSDILGYLEIVGQASPSASVSLLVIRDGDEVEVELRPHRRLGPIG